MPNNNLLYKIAISLIPRIGPVNAKSLISYCSGVENVFNTPKSILLKIPGIGEFGANQILKHKQNALEIAEKELIFIEKHKIQTAFYLDKDYPILLKQCKDAPIMLYYKGNIDINDKNVISVVGTRKATPDGKENCKNLITDLNELGHNPIIISGLAYGIDICAHKTALENKLKTIAVLGHGLDRIYPDKHRNTAKEIIESGGAVMTEYLSSSKFDRQNFLQRNRIIAGISTATVIVQSAAKGGSLTTADIANSYNRDVFAFPGRIIDKYHAGCNKLIKQHKAYLIESAKDLEYVLGWEKSGNKIPKQNVLFVELTSDEKNIVEILNDKGGLPLDLICKVSEFPIGKISSLLLGLEFKNVVRCLPGKVYELTSTIISDKI